jgi:Na+/phosphate symporter
VFEVDLYGKTVKLKKATYGQTEEYYEKIAACENDPKAIMKAVKDFLTSLGLDAEDFKELESEHINELIDLVSGSKKK